MKKIILLVCLATLSLLNTFAQGTFNVPKNYTLKEADDYTQYEADMIEAAKWLEKTDLDKETYKRQEVNQFVIEWISGSPTVSIEITEQIANLYDKNPQLLGVYMANYTREYLENGEDATKESAIKVGLISMINVYKKGIEIKKNKELDKVSKMTDAQLDTYIKENF